MFALGAFEVICLIIALAGIATFFWLAIRAMNVYIARNTISRPSPGGSG